MTGQTPSEETLMAYADGELPPAERAAVEAAIAADPALAERVEAHRALRARVSSAYAPAADDPLPANLLAMLGASKPEPAAPVAPADVVNLAQVRAARTQAAAVKPVARSRPWVKWTAIAAGVVGLLVVGRLALVDNGPSIGAQGNQLVAQGSLAKALDNQLASEPGTGAPVVQVGLSFRDNGGLYCRTFRTKSDAGVACREPRAWAVRMVTQAAAPQQGAYRMAASETPPAVTAAVEAMIAGDPLDAAAEKKAVAARWQR